MQNKKFIAVMNIPSPYRIHMWRELATQLTTRGFSFQVHFMARGHKERPKSWLNPIIPFQYKYWLDLGFGQHHFNPSLVLKLIFSKPSVLFVGNPYDTFTGIFVSLFCRADVKVCGLEGNTKTPGKISGFIGWFKRFILSKYDYITAPGVDGAAFNQMHRDLTTRKMPYTVYLPNIIDETRFKPRSEWPGDVIENIRNKIGVSKSDCMCITPARLTAVKGLIQYFEALPVDLLFRWKLVLMGEGEQRKQLEEIAYRRGFADKVIIIDCVPYDEMPAYYAAADLMLLPSIRDQNPLSVVEALHTGLAVALSDQVGNVEEAVSDRRNGWRLPVKDVEEFSTRLREIFSTSSEKLQEMGSYGKKENSIFWNTKNSIGKFIEGIVK